MSRVKVTVESDELAKPMVYEELVMFTCVCVEEEITGGHKTVTFGIGDLNPDTVMSTIITMAKIIKELTGKIQETVDPVTFMEFLSEMDSEIKALSTDENMFNRKDRSHLI